MKKMFLFLLVSAMCGSAAVSAQTKRIAHRSHSGSNASFNPATGRDNWGDTPAMRRARHERDSVEFARDSKTLRYLPDSTAAPKPDSNHSKTIRPKKKAVRQ